jgi:hypothetical protein
MNKTVLRRLRYRLDNRKVVGFPVEARGFSFLKNIQAGS